MRINTSIQDLINDPPDFKNDERFDKLDKYESYFRNTAYDNRKFTWDGRPIAPGGDVKSDNFYGVQIGDLSGASPTVAERKPSIIYPMPRMIVNRFVSLLFGEHRFPTFHFPTDPETEEWFSNYLSKIHLKENVMEAATNGGAIGSTVVAFKMFKDHIQLESFNTKWITPLWKDFHAGEMLAFRFMYPYQTHVYNQEKEEYELKWLLYRRVVTESEDIVFEPQDLIKTDEGEFQLKDKKERPKKDKTQSSVHALGLCPAIFIQNIPRYDQIDGDPCPEGAYELFDAINEQLSAIHYALHGTLDPTLVIALNPDEAAKLGYKPGGDIPLGSRGKGLVVGEKGSVKFLEMEGDIVKIAMELVNKLREYALEICQCVIADPVRLSGNAQSAAAIVKLFEYMLAKADILRCQYGERGMKPLVVKLAKALKKRPDLVKTIKRPDQSGTIKTLKPNLDIDQDDICVVWGDYFEPMISDVFQAAEAVGIARANLPTTTTERAVKFLAAFFKDPNPLQTIREVNQEIKENQDREDAQAQAKLVKPSPGVSK